jgi:hypothetical protein
MWAECLKMWEPQPLANLKTSTACTGITLPYLTYLLCNLVNVYLVFGRKYYLHLQDRIVCFFQMFVWAGWLLAAYFAYLSAFSPSNLGLRDYRYNVNDASIYAAFSPIVCSLALSWLIWACFTGHGGKHETNKPPHHYYFPSSSPPSCLYSPV